MRATMAFDTRSLAERLGPFSAGARARSVSRIAARGRFGLVPRNSSIRDKVTPPVAGLMLDQIDIYRSAKLLIHQHGTEAPIHAAMNADAVLERGGLDGRAVWLRILSAVNELQRRQPSDRAVH